MRILFLNPPFKTEFGRFSRSSRSPAITKSGTLYYPIWLGYAAAVAEEAGHEIKLLDSCASRLDLEKTLEAVSGFRPGLAVIDTSTPSIFNDVDVGRRIKQLLPDCAVALMGTHPSALPEETLRLDPCTDAIAVGEADYTIRELAGRLAGSDPAKLREDAAYRSNVLGAVEGLAWRRGEDVVVNRKREFIRDLDGLPFLSRFIGRHLNVRDYFFAASDYPLIQIMTARGCVGKCTFCVYPQTIHGGRYRVRSPQSIADEFEWVSKNMPEVRQIGIEDDTFTGSARRVTEFCREIIRRKVRMKWCCNVRADLRPETMAWMKKAGCALVIAGYESANADILEGIGKGITPDEMLVFSRNARKAGLLVHGCFMVGNRGESRKTMDETLRLALRLRDDTVQFFPLMAYPGTADFSWAAENGLLEAKNYADYLSAGGLHKSSVRTFDMTGEELARWCDYARRKYYLRPRYLFYKALRMLRHPSRRTTSPSSERICGLTARM
ncbi:MAG: radical SAM protein [Nitrospiraceae bacterium]|nr:radical SAM protein [Nitrospiraceae bacterium]